MTTAIDGPAVLTLREHRERAGYRREELAAATGLALSTITNAELGHRPPSLDSAHRIAAVLGIRPADIQETQERLDHLRQVIAAAEADPQPAYHAHPPRKPPLSP